MAEVLSDLANVIPILLNLVPVLVIMLTSCLLSKVGRKTLLQIGTLIEVMSLIIVSVGYFLNSDEGKIMIVVGLFIWMIGFGLSLGPIVWLYIAEIIQPDFIPFPTTVNWFMAALVAILFPILLQAFGSAGPIFAFFAGYTLLFMFINQKCLL